MRNLAYRRHHAKRIKRRAQKIIRDVWLYDRGSSKKWIDFQLRWANCNSNNLKVCSCSICGNPRKHWGKKTRQEKIADIVEKEYRIDLNKKLERDYRDLISRVVV